MSEARRVLGRLWPAMRRGTPPETVTRPRTAWLAVVQARLENEAYRSPQAFQDYVTGLALRANAFATPAVRLQREWAHIVVDSGVYSVVRHPFYAADPLIFVGLGLWLESYLAVLLTIIPVALLIVRLCLEERFLRRELPGYEDYTLRVRHRLIPGFW